MKTCARCKHEKPSESFARQATHTDGLRSWCKACIRATAPPRGAVGRKRNRDAARDARARCPESLVLAVMVQRCHNPKAPDFPRYGGRGIRVADEWRGVGGVARFLAHVGPRPSAEYSIDRIDNALGYVAGNVRWATRTEQARNTRHNRWLDLDGKRMCLTDWAAHVGIDHRTLTARLNRGWDLRRALYASPMRAAGLLD